QSMVARCRVLPGGCRCKGGSSRAALVCRSAPASRCATDETKPLRRASAPRRRREQRAHLALRLAEVLLVFDDERKRLADGRRVELAHAERTEAARPVERLGDARRLAELELTE